MLRYAPDYKKPNFIIPQGPVVPGVTEWSSDGWGRGGNTGMSYPGGGYSPFRFAAGGVIDRMFGGGQQPQPRFQPEQPDHVGGMYGDFLRSLMMLRQQQQQQSRSNGGVLGFIGGGSNATI